MNSPLRLALLPSFVLLAACPPPPGGADAGPDASTLQAPELTSVLPTRGPIAGGTSITVNGANFEEGAQVLFGGAAATQVVLVNKRKLTARTPAAGAIGPVNVSVVNPDGQSALLPNGFLYETAAARVIDEALVLNELATFDATGANPVAVTVLADVSVPSVTSAAGQGAGVKAQVGWTAMLAGTPQASAWTWTDAAYTADADGPGLGDLARDRYTGVASLPGATGPDAKVYSLAARFSLDDGATWTFADRDGASNGVAAAQVPKVTLSRPLVDWCKLGGELVGAPPEVKLKVGQPGVQVFGQVYRANLTNQG
ncbi:MAG: IPT/TIG domain-containing protein, partial [Myxococcaceae bacterium]